MVCRSYRTERYHCKRLKADLPFWSSLSRQTYHETVVTAKDTPERKETETDTAYEVTHTSGSRIGKSPPIGSARPPLPPSAHPNGMFEIGAVVWHAEAFQCGGYDCSVGYAGYETVTAPGGYSPPVLQAWFRAKEQSEPRPTRVRAKHEAPSCRLTAHGGAASGCTRHAKWRMRLRGFTSWRMRLRGPAHAMLR